MSDLTKQQGGKRWVEKPTNQSKKKRNNRMPNLEEESDDEAIHVPRRKFRFTGRGMLLTYPAWIDLEDLFKAIKPLFQSELVHFKGVHERGSTGHQHSHVVLYWKSKIEFRSAHKFDFFDLHPNIKKLPSKRAVDDADDYCEKDIVKGEDHIFEWDKEPEGEESVQSSGDLLRDIVNAESLWDAIEAAGIRPRSVNDVKLIREDKKRRTGTGTTYPESSWTRPITSPGWKVLIITGGTGLGKTQWAIAHFTRALVVSHPDDLKHFDSRLHDGIIFDDMGFKHLHREFIIHLCDWDLDRSIHCRHYCAYIPRHTRKIFTTNLPFEQLFPEDPSGAIMRRITAIIEIDEVLFSEATNEDEAVNFIVPEAPEYDSDASVDSLD